MSEYINRVLNHPYYIDTNQIVDLIVNEETNQITVIVSSKDESDKLVDYKMLYNLEVLLKMIQIVDRIPKKNRLILKR